MRRTYRIALTLALAGIAGILPMARAQQNKVTQDKGIPGYLNPRTGAFTPVQQNTADAQALAAIVPTTGKFIFNFTLNVLSTVPKNGIVSCEADVSVTEGSTGQFITEHVAGIAIKGTGTTWTCSLPMPYSWILSTPSTDSAVISEQSEIDEGFQATATNGTAIVVVPIVTRLTRQNVGSVKIPANGSTTTQAISATM